jgi:hypothetical protein
VIAANDQVERAPLDWAPMFRAFHEMFEYVLDVAADAARNFPDEVAAVERVRTFVRRRIAGYAAHVRMDDVLFAFALMLVGLERQRLAAA